MSPLITHSVNGRKPASRHSPALPYKDISDKAGRVLSGWSGEGGITHSPKSGNTYDFNVPGRALLLFLELVAGGRGFDPKLPIYLIAITCHKSRYLDDKIKAAYEWACVITNQPLFGAWKKGSDEFVDVVVPIAFNSEEDAKKMGKRYDQQTIIRIDPDGSAEPIKTN